MTETHPDLLVAQHDLNALVNLLAAGRFKIADDVAELSNSVRWIAAGYTPETLQSSADAILVADRVMKSFQYLTRTLELFPSEAQALLKGCRVILTAYAQATLATDSGLWNACLTTPQEV
ncbi:MAG TPA: hypothetical protein VF885_08295 [Arthrobacter sp.]